VNIDRLLYQPCSGDPARHRRTDSLEVGGRWFGDRRRTISRPPDDNWFRCLHFAALCYIVALKKIPVSIAFPSVSASYAVIAVLAHILWNEPLGWTQIGGILLISSGVLLIHQH
jgi:hypothetical protein